MKKLLLLLTLSLFCLMLFACGSADSTTPDETTLNDTTLTEQAPTDSQEPADSTTSQEDTSPEGNDFTKKSGKEMLDILTEDVKNQLTLVVEELDLADKDSFRYHFFIDEPDSVKNATIAQPMIGTIPFFLGILKVETAKEADALADEILDHVNYQKLICASYKKAYTRAVGNTVILIMDIDPDRAKTMVDLFDSLAA